MQGFAGFPDGKLKSIGIPTLFFSELLPAIDDLAELRVTLYAFWALHQKEGQVRYLRQQDFVNDPVFVRSFGKGTVDSAETLLHGLELAVQRGTLLHITVEGEAGATELYFMNTERGRAAVEGIMRGQWRPNPDEEGALSLLIERPNIFTLYEQNIGVMTPLIAEQLRDAEQTYPPRWIEEAIKVAVENNARNWRYVLAILERWRLEGKQDGQSGPRHATESRQQIPDEYKDVIER